MVLSTSYAFPKVHFIVILLAVSVFWSTPFLLTDIAYSTQPSEVGFTVTVVPSSVVARVGEKVAINVTVTSEESSPMGRVCFSVQGFPDSGFSVSFLPECATSQLNRMAVILTVEVTAAAAPERFTAFIIARSEHQTAQTTLDVTVEPAFPPWITWVGILLFLLILGMAITGKPKLPIRPIKRLLGRGNTLETTLGLGSLMTRRQESAEPPTRNSQQPIVLYITVSVTLRKWGMLHCVVY